MPKDLTTTELLKDPDFKRMIEAREKAKSFEATEKITKTTNQYGEEVHITYSVSNAYYDGFKNAYFVSDKFNEMVKKTIPCDIDILSVQFKDWLITSKNQLVRDTRINLDDYFSYTKNFETGEVKKNSPNEILVLQKETLDKELGRLEKAFKTFLNNPKAYATKEVLDNRLKYLEQRTQNIKEAQAQGIESLMKLYEKHSEVNEANVEVEADKNLANIDRKMAAIDEAIAKTNTKINAEKPSMPDEIKNLDVNAIRKQK